jgi:hypothetical protein
MMKTRKTRKPAAIQPVEGVSFDRETRDFVVYVAGELVGFAATPVEANERYHAALTARTQFAARAVA